MFCFAVINSTALQIFPKLGENPGVYSHVIYIQILAVSDVGCNKTEHTEQRRLTCT